MTTINELSPPEDLENWAYENFWDIISEIPSSADFSDLQLALIGVRAAKRCSRKWDPEKLPFLNFMLMEIQDFLTKAAEEGNYLTGAEKALNLVNGGN